MASGQVNRIKRPNTWLQRPMLQNREESSCQTGAVHTWHLASFRCDAEFGPLPAAHIGRRVAIKLDRWVPVLVFPAGRWVLLEVTTGTILARIRYA
jgi:hypothetical protein